MALKIERKFLLKNDTWRNLSNRNKKIDQGYLANTERGSIRVRLFGDQANINIKSMTLGVSRTEYEYSIPVNDAHDILENLCMLPIIKLSVPIFYFIIL